MVATQHCYFADMAYETKCVWIACPYQQSSNAGLLPWCRQLMCMWCFFLLWLCIWVLLCVFFWEDSLPCCMGTLFCNCFGRMIELFFEVGPGRPRIHVPIQVFIYHVHLLLFSMGNDTQGHNISQPILTSTSSCPTFSTYHAQPQIKHKTTTGA